MSMRMSILAISSLILNSCMSSGSTAQAPRLKNSDSQTLSVLDTLVVEFDQPLASFDQSNFSSATPLLSQWSKDHPTIVKFMGVKTYPGNGAYALLPADSMIKIQFLKIQGENGKTTDTLGLSFKTMLLADSDFVTGVRNTVDVPSADSLMSGAKFLAGSFRGQSYGVQSYAGVLSGSNEFAGGRDEVDYYRIQLAYGDSLKLDFLPSGAVASKSKCSDQILVELLGPKKLGVPDGPAVWARRDTAKLNSDCHSILALAIDADRQVQALDLSKNEGIATPKDYWIRISYRSTALQGFTPYRFEMARIQKK